MPADQVARHRVERLGHLDVVVAMHLGRGVVRQVIGSDGHGGEDRGLERGEVLGRPARRRAVHAQPGRRGAPLHGPALGVGSVDEVLAGEERAAARRAPCARPGACPWDGAPASASTRKPRSWAYSTKASLSRGSVGLALSTMAAMLSGITTAKIPPKNAQAASKPSMTSAIVWEKVSHTKQ